MPFARLLRSRGAVQLLLLSATGVVIKAELPPSASTSTTTVALPSICTWAAVPEIVKPAASVAFKMLLPPAPSTAVLSVIAAERSIVIEALPVALLPARSLTVAETLTVPSWGSEKRSGSKTKLQLLVPLLLVGVINWLMPLTLTTVVLASLLASLPSTRPAATSAPPRLVAVLIGPWKRGLPTAIAGPVPIFSLRSAIGATRSAFSTWVTVKGLPAKSLPLTVTS